MSNFLLDHGVLLIVGGEIDNVPQNRVTAHVLPDAKSHCKAAPLYPIAVTGAVGIIMSKEITICGGLLRYLFCLPKLAKHSIDKGFPLIWRHFSNYVFLFCTAKKQVFKNKTG